MEKRTFDSSDLIKYAPVTISVLGLFYMLSVAYNSIGDLKQRQTKKIEVQNELIREVNDNKLQDQKRDYELRNEMLQMKLELQEKIHELELKIKENSP